AARDGFHWIWAIENASVNSVIRRAPDGGAVAFAKGLQIQLLLNEEKFVGTNAFLFGAVMSHFFSRYVSVNSFTETAIISRQRGTVKTWRGVPGKRHLI